MDWFLYDNGLRYKRVTGLSHWHTKYSFFVATDLNRSFEKETYFVKIVNNVEKSMFSSLS